MSIPSNESAAKLSISLAHEFYHGACVYCNKVYEIEMHEIYRRQMRKILGASVCILGVTLAPLCKECHAEWDTLTTETQIQALQYRLITNIEFQIAQREQLIAIKTRILKA